MAPTAPGLRNRLLALACIAAAVGAGAITFAVGGAPASYGLVNGLALLVAAVALLWPETDHRPPLASVVAVAAVALLAAALALGPGTLGVHRWLPLGPLRLHIGMMVLPALVVVLPRLGESPALAATACCAALVWAQPDFAAAMALFAGVAAASIGRERTPVFHATRLVAAVGLVLTSFQPDPLGAVRFVETALSDGWAISPLLGGLTAVTLVLAILLPPRLVDSTTLGMSAPARGLAGAMGGFAIAGLLANFPQPLVGYGASPILGYGLALAVLRFSR